MITKKDVEDYIKELKILYDNEFSNEEFKTWCKKQIIKFEEKIKEIKDN